MSEAALIELLILVGTALGLVLLGAARVILAARSRPVRLAATACCVITPAVVPAALGYPAAAVATVGLASLAAIGTAVVGSARVTAAIVAVIHGVRRPAVQASLLAVGGGALFVGSLARFDMEVEAGMDRDLAYMMEVTWKPPLRPVEAPVTTDTGRPIELWVPSAPRTSEELTANERRILDGLGYAERVIRVGPAAEECNCHGWVFTGGRYWLSDVDVQQILADNNYQTVSQPRAGDLVVYREGTRITHTAVVRSAPAEGPVLVQGKWGWMGLFLHQPDASCYGGNFTYYRAQRPSHLLVGLGGHPATTGRAPDAPVATSVPAGTDPDDGE